MQLVCVHIIIVCIIILVLVIVMYGSLHVAYSPHMQVRIEHIAHDSFEVGCILCQ